MAFRRANPHLEEIVEILAMHLAKHGGDEDKARSYLSKDDNDWIDEEVLKCITETRYFISNYYAYKDEKEGFKGLYPLFDSQEILHNEYRRLEKEYGRVRALVLKARQMGSTTYNVAEFFQKTVFSEHINGIMVGQDEDQANYIYGMYASAYDFMPWWMKPRTAIRQEGKKINFDEKDQALRATRPGLKTWIYAENANKPSGVGRGRTFNRGVLSELAFWQNGSQLSKSLFPTMNTPDGHYVMESTANGRNDFWHNLWRRAEAGKIDWHPIFIPYFRRDKTYSLPLRKGQVFILTEDESAMRQTVLAKENYLIKDEVFNWARNKKEEFVATDGDDKMFSQEYASNPEEAFQSSSITAFPQGIINKLIKRTRNPKWIGEIYYDFSKDRPTIKVREVHETEHVLYPETENRFHMWEKPEAGAVYCVGVDVSLGNAGGDYSCGQIIKTSDGDRDSQVACWHGLMDPESLAEIVLALCWYYNEALAAVEVNNMGLSTNNALVRKYEYENIYRYKHLDKLSRWMTDTIGFYTNEKTHRAIMSKLSKSLVEDTIDIPCRFTCDEFNDFTEDGAIGKDAHDDFLMALMIALYCAHENEYKDMREGRTQEREGKPANEFVIKDRFGTQVGEKITSQREAEALSRKHIGSSIVRISNNTGPITIGGKLKRSPKDFQNSEYAPWSDGDGTARKMFEDGYEPEEMSPEAMAQYEAEMEETEDSPNAWLYS